MLLKSREQFIKCVPTAASGDWNDMETYVEDAERWLRNEYLGSALYARLEQEYEDPEHKELLDLCRKVISLDAYQRAIPFLDLIQTANGFGIISNQNLTPASRDRVNRLANETISQRDEAVETMLDLLEDTPAYHDDWKGAKAYSVISDCLIMTAKELKRLCSFEGTRKDFLKLKPVLLLRMYNELGRWVSRAFIAELVEQQRDGDVTPANAEVIDMLKISLANYATDNIQDAEAFRNEAVTIMDLEPEQYPTYSSSREYRIRHNIESLNSADSPIFFMGGI